MSKQEEQEEFIPYTLLDSKEIKMCPELHEGDAIICSRCGKQHVVYSSIPGEDGTLFYECGKYTYLAGLNGRDIRRHLAK